MGKSASPPQLEVATAGELLTALQALIKKHPERADFPVILARDAEGNGFSPMHREHSVCLDHYEESPNPWLPGDVADGVENAVVLWPCC